MEVTTHPNMLPLADGEAKGRPRRRRSTEVRAGRQEVPNGPRPDFGLHAGKPDEMRARYKIRTPDEADSLARHLAHYFMEPEMAAIGLWELFSNAIEHGNLAIGRERKTELLLEGRFHDEVAKRLEDPAYKDRIVVVSIEIKSSKIRIRIVDEGAGFEYIMKGIADDIDITPNGRGLMIINSMKYWNVAYSGRGNIVSVTAFSRDVQNVN